MVKIIGDVNREAMQPIQPVKPVELPPRPPMDDLYVELEREMRRLDARITGVERILKALTETPLSTSTASRPDSRLLLTS